MLYVQQSLSADEELIQVGEFHWMYTVNACMSIVWGLVGSIMALYGSVFFYKQMGYFPPDLDFIKAIPYLHPGLRILSFFVFIMGVLTFVQMMVIKATTEIAVTNARLVYKRGLIARQIGEIRIDRIEGVNVLQTIFGRIFNYGRLAVRGTGVGEVVLPPIAEPIEFRKSIQNARLSEEKGKAA